MTLVNGILNIMYGLGVTAAIVLGTLGIGLLSAPITVLPTVLGIFEILYATKILSDTLSDAYNPTKQSQSWKFVRSSQEM